MSAETFLPLQLGVAVQPEGTTRGQKMCWAEPGHTTTEDDDDDDNDDLEK